MKKKKKQVSLRDVDVPNAIPCITLKTKHTKGEEIKGV